MPTNIAPKHDGQAITESTDPQKSHCASSVPAPAPQFGQFSDMAIEKRVASIVDAAVALA
jgi:hypothetical protein